jgi:hypothetical protein
MPHASIKPSQSGRDQDHDHLMYIAGFLICEICDICGLLSGDKPIALV